MARVRFARYKTKRGAEKYCAELKAHHPERIFKALPSNREFGIWQIAIVDEAGMIQCLVAKRPNFYDCTTNSTLR